MRGKEEMGREGYTDNNEHECAEKRRPPPPSPPPPPPPPPSASPTFMLLRTFDNSGHHTEDGPGSRGKNYGQAHSDADGVRSRSRRATAPKPRLTRRRRCRSGLGRISRAYWGRPTTRRGYAFYRKRGRCGEGVRACRKGRRGEVDTNRYKVQLAWTGTCSLRSVGRRAAQRPRSHPFCFKPGSELSRNMAATAAFAARHAVTQRCVAAGVG